MSLSGIHPSRSFTRNHDLLPASRPASQVGLSSYEPIPHIPTHSFISWTLGRGSVIWRIWPAVLLHTVFAGVVVTVSMQGLVHVDIPSIMLTVLGVVIGFVISYRASSGYDRYWLGRTCWSDVIRTSRTLGRLIWFHTPPRLTPKTPQELETGQVARPEKEMMKVMNEKRIALDLIEGFVVSLKHHIRGELGIYYEDLYHLVLPLHPHDHTASRIIETTTTGVASPRRSHRITTNPPAPQATTSAHQSSPSTDRINAYGTFGAPPPRHHTQENHQVHRRTVSQTSSISSVSSSSSISSHHRPLLPSSLGPNNKSSWFRRVSSELIPFSGLVSIITHYFWPPIARANINITSHPDDESGHRWRGPVMASYGYRGRPKVTGMSGQNLPLEVLRCLSEWLSVLEDRNTVPGTSLGQMMGAITAFEESLTALERILTTPLPFVYSVHIRHTVWLYLFLLPFQLVKPFEWYTIPGVAIASFIFLGFLAAGEEIEQPFGYDDNDLDLDLFCREIVHADMEHLKTSACLNAYFAPGRVVPMRSRTMSVVDLSARDEELLVEGEAEEDNASPILN